MMNIQFFLLSLLIVSTLTGLVTEGIKNSLKEYGKECRPNTLAGCVSLLLSAGVGTGYAILTHTKLTPQFATMILSLMLLSWLSAMVGYDKVVQAIAQFTAAIPAAHEKAQASMPEQEKQEDEGSTAPEEDTGDEDEAGQGSGESEDGEDG